jgi:hypothetical protein
MQAVAAQSLMTAPLRGDLEASEAAAAEMVGTARLILVAVVAVVATLATNGIEPVAETPAVMAEAVL